MMHIANRLTWPFFCAAVIFTSLASYSDISKMTSLINETVSDIILWCPENNCCVHV